MRMTLDTLDHYKSRLFGHLLQSNTKPPVCMHHRSRKMFQISLCVSWWAAFFEIMVCHIWILHPLFNTSIAASTRCFLTSACHSLLPLPTIAYTLLRPCWSLQLTAYWEWKQALHNQTRVFKNTTGLGPLFFTSLCFIPLPSLYCSVSKGLKTQIRYSSMVSFPKLFFSIAPDFEWFQKWKTQW